MKIFAISPIFRLSIGLILLTISLLLVCDLLGFVPNQDVAEFNARKIISESLAVQVSTDVAHDNMDSVTSLIHSLQARNESILSIGLRTIDERLIASAGDHIHHWQPVDKNLSTSTHVQVPIHDNSGRWGTVEISFEPIDASTSVFSRSRSIITIIIFIAISGFFAYWLFLKRALNELDPSAVVPDRVRAALNVLAEGLVILDSNGRIVFVNVAFEQKLGQSEKMLIGKKLSSLNWMFADQEIGTEATTLPWQLSLDNLETKPTLLTLRTTLNEQLRFAVNIAPIQAPDGKIRGVVVTFDDVTELEHKNSDLQRALTRIKHSQHEITRQNKELQILATRDPMTGLLNRRALFEGFVTLLKEVQDEGEILSCIMLDIDHFKLVNDRFGHATGDIVIKLLAKIMLETARADDLFGRYGGEEFCIVLPCVDEQQAAKVAERIRIAVNEVKGDESTGIIPFNASFGVACINNGKLKPEFIIDLADKALYHAKESGRNKVSLWSAVEHLDKLVTTEITDATKQAKPVNNSPKIVVNNDATPSMKEQQLQQQITELETLIGAHKTAAVNATKSSSDFPNQVVLIDRIKQAIERSSRFNTQIAALLIDIDTLQVIRNTQGEVAAEKMVKLLAGRLKKTLRSTDTVSIDGAENIGVSVSRINNGEFAVLLTDIKGEESITWIIQRLFASLGEPVQLEGAEVFLDTRIGTCIYPGDGKDSETLLTNASMALREAKSSSERDTCLYYNQEMNIRSKTQLHMEGQLHRAIERNELFLEYQPVVALDTGRIASFEALLRWRHPELGVVSPEDFISVAENAGIIDDIGNWVLENACRQLKAWQIAGYEDLTMAVNFSALQLRKPELVDEVLCIVEQTGLLATSLTVEITESALIQNFATTEITINALSRAGMRISLDDFGTGYSSLSYLKHFPIDVVKIDKSFLHDFPDHDYDTSIVNAIIAMAHSLGLHVVAEGVEIEKQLQKLLLLKCDSIQGYLFSKPILRKQATLLLANQSVIRSKVWANESSDIVVDNVALAGVLNRVPTKNSVA